MDLEHDTMADSYLGLISGTSADAVDAALVTFEPRPLLLAHLAYPWPTPLREEILRLSQDAADTTLDAVAWLDAAIGETFAAAALALLAELPATVRGTVRAIGSHGQTLRHAPRGDPGFTLQLGDPHRIAERTGLPVVADFRRRDVAAGGEGAPLMPAFHAAILAAPDEDRAVLNLGGIANLTLLPRRGGVRGFDTGPANALLDAWAQRSVGTPHDVDGAWARSGQVDAALLARLLDEPYFRVAPPKSTGRDHFHLEWLAGRLGSTPPAAIDVQATLVELTARTVADALRAAQPDTDRVLACGGGARNRFLMERLAAALAPAALQTTDTYGVNADFLEAMGFAWLARETLAGRPGNLPSVTGARGPRVLGAIHPV